MTVVVQTFRSALHGWPEGLHYTCPLWLDGSARAEVAAFWHVY